MPPTLHKQSATQANIANISEKPSHGQHTSTYQHTHTTTIESINTSSTKIVQNKYKISDMINWSSEHFSFSTNNKKNIQVLKLWTKFVKTYKNVSK